ncbi:MAG: hypothetical protein PWR10_1647 [Halanaerobiales bacterium]|nr:hypothetical protein [Halanaerobiales bacterium]
MDGFPDATALARFIRENFMGSFITIRVNSGLFITGEVVDGFDNIVAIKFGGVTFFINGDQIDFFF